MKWAPEDASAVRPVRVALVLSDGLAGRGGITRVVGYLKDGFEALPDIDATIVAARLTDAPFLKHPSVLVSLAAFAAQCARGAFDVVHVNVAPRGSTWRKRLYAQVARRFGLPVVLHLHGSAYDTYFAGLSAGRQAKARSFFRNADTVVALSSFWRNWLIETMGLDAERVIEIANGVPAAENLTETTRAVPRIVFLGLLGKRKGVDVLLNALADLQARGLDFEAVLAGNGEVDEARDAAQRLGLAGKIDFPGWVGDAEVDALLRQADIFVLPSRDENQPVAILEAMARSVPVVATSVGAIPEQVRDGETGVLVPPGEAAPLADALARLVGDPALRRRMGQAGKARFEQLFCTTAQADRFAALYRRLAA